METIEQISESVRKIAAAQRSQSEELNRLRQLSESQLSEAKQLMDESRLAQEWARRSFRIDREGYLWRWDLERKLYVKTSVRINQISPRCLPGTINDKSVTLKKLADNVIDWIKSMVRTLAGRIRDVEGSVSELQRQVASGINPKYHVMTQDEYDALESYEPNVPYFIVERTNTQWRFGDNLPIILGGYGTALGEPFPIILN